MKCPYCAEDIADAAILCKHCRSRLDVAPSPPLPATSAPNGAQNQNTTGPRVYSSPKQLVKAVSALCVIFACAVVAAEGFGYNADHAKGQAYWLRWADKWKSIAASIREAPAGSVAAYSRDRYFGEEIHVRYGPRDAAENFVAIQNRTTKDHWYVCDVACAEEEAASNLKLASNSNYGSNAALFNLLWLALTVSVAWVVRSRPGPAAGTQLAHRLAAFGLAAAAMMGLAVAAKIFLHPRHLAEGTAVRIYTTLGASLIAMGVLQWQALRAPLIEPAPQCDPDGAAATTSEGSASPGSSGARPEANSGQ